MAAETTAQPCSEQETPAREFGTSHLAMSSGFPTNSPPPEIGDFKEAPDLAELAEEIPEGSPNVPAEFRVQLGMLDCLARQGRLLDQLSDQQHAVSAQLTSLKSAAARQQELATARQLELTGSLQELLQLGQQKVLAGGGFDAGGKGVAARCDGEVSTPKTSGRRRKSRESKLDQRVCVHGASAPPFIDVRQDHGLKIGLISPALHGLDAIHATSEGSSSLILGKKSFHGQEKSRLFRSASSDRLHWEMRIAEGEIGHKVTEKTKQDLSGILTVESAFMARFRNAVSSQMFELVCGAVIAFDAILTGYQSDRRIRWTVEHVGENYDDDRAFMQIIGYSVMLFYTVELLLKLVAHRREFFTGKEVYWDLFDCGLVVLALFDFFMDFFGITSNLEVTWLRIVRLLKMLKALRVVRVMRFFKELRTMMVSIASSISKFFWCVLMITLVMYIFSICFLDGLSSYLSDSDPLSEDAADEEVLGLVFDYWGSVAQAVLTLYYCITGGSDWEPLALPLRRAGDSYHFIFLSYIAFSLIAVLNVVTGIFVEAAANAAEMDESKVSELHAACRDVLEFKQDLTRRADEHQHISFQDFEESLEASAGQSFLRVLGIDEHDGKQVFNMLARGNMANIADLVGGAMKIRRDVKGLDILSLKADIKRIAAYLGKCDVSRPFPQVDAKESPRSTDDDSKTSH